MIRIKRYYMGKPIDVCQESHSALIEAVLPDGRTVQLAVRPDGEIDLRAWGNVPALVGNSNSIGFHCKLEREDATTCSGCHHKFEECGCVA